MDKTKYLWNDRSGSWVRADWVAIAIFGLVVMYVLSLLCIGGGQPPTADDLIGDVVAPEMMIRMSKEMKTAKVIKVTEGVYIAVGYALANVMLLEGPSGAVIIDTTESVDSAQEVLAALRNVSKLPIRGIIYTHNHADHTQGASVFVADAPGPVEIWAHHEFTEQIEQMAFINEIFMARGIRQFGALLPNKVSAGIGNSLRYNMDSEILRMGLVLPNKVFFGPSKDIVLAGLKLRLVHIPGETPDQIGVWMKDKRVLCSGDDIYKAFPNLYAIRGTPTRNVRQWFKSIDVIRALRPEYLVPMHGHPLSGAAYIQNVTSIYRDAIQFVHDQTIRYMNMGYFPQDIVKELKLPKEYASHPYLYELYGNIEWSVKAVFDQYLGWFSGNPVELSNLGTLERAERMVDLAGGVPSIISAARKAYDAGDARWALELSSHIFLLHPDNAEARNVRLLALKFLASQQTSTNGRNYYLTTALEDHGLVKLKVSQEQRLNYMTVMTLPHLFLSFQTRLIPENCIGINETYVFNFTDINQTYSWHIRRGILDIEEGPDENYVAKLSMTTDVWRDIIGGVRSQWAAYVTGDISLEGSYSAVRRFGTYFDRKFLG